MDEFSWSLQKLVGLGTWNSQLILEPVQIKVQEFLAVLCLSVMHEIVCCHLSNTCKSKTIFTSGCKICSSVANVCCLFLSESVVLGVAFAISWRWFSVLSDADVLFCFRGLRLLLVNRQAGRAPSADAQTLILLLDMGNFQKAELEVTTLPLLVTSHSTQKRSFWRRSPSQSLGLVS